MQTDVNNDEAADFLAMILKLEHPGLIIGDAGTMLDNSMKVYRIEMPNGNGPYNSGYPNAQSIYEELCKPVKGFDCARLARGVERAGITERKFWKTHGDASYSCSSLGWLCRWFQTPAREYLKTLDATLWEYEIPAGEYILKLPHGEIVFNRFNARRLRSMDVVTLT